MAKVDYRKIKTTTVAMKVESVRGTYETLAAADTYCVQNATLPTVTPNILELDCSNGTLTPADNTVLIGDEEVTFNFDIAFPISELATTPYSDYLSNIGLLWTAGGFVTSDAGGVSITSTPDDDADDSISFSYNVGGWEYRARGCVANEIKISAIIKQAVFMNISLIGTLESRSEQTPLAKTGIYSPDKEVCGGLTFRLTDDNFVTAYLSKCNSAVLTITNTVIPIESITATKGIAYHAIIDRDTRIMFECSPFYVGTDQKDEDVYGFYTDSTKVEIDLSGAGNEIIQLKGKITAFEGKDVNGAFKNDVEIRVTGTGAETAPNLPIYIKVYSA